MPRPVFDVVLVLHAGALFSANWLKYSSTLHGVIEDAVRSRCLTFREFLR